MTTERIRPAVPDYETFIFPLQLLTGEAADISGSPKEHYSAYRRYERLAAPLPGIGKAAVSALIAGRADMGYKLRVRGFFPSAEQSTFVVAPVQDRARRDAWVGVDSIRSLRVPFSPLQTDHEGDWLPGAVQPDRGLLGFTEVVGEQRLDFFHFVKGMLHLSQDIQFPVYPAITVAEATVPEAEARVEAVAM